MHGSDHTGSKLSEAQVRAIRKRAADGSVSQAALAREYAVSTALVSKIINRKVWTHM
jgi:DNA-binding transcriptional regulator YiaG